MYSYGRSKTWESILSVMAEAVIVLYNEAVDAGCLIVTAPAAFVERELRVDEVAVVLDEIFHAVEDVRDSSPQVRASFIPRFGL